MSQGNMGGPGGGWGGGGGYGPPPGGPPGGGGYGPPPGAGAYGPPPGAGGGDVNLSAFTERSPITVLLLSLVTCGIYFIVWKYQTTDELRRASGDESLNPTTDLLITLVSCGIYAIYVSYRNAQKVYQLSQRLGLQRSDQGTAVLLLAIFGLAAVNIFILQGEYNAMAQAGRARLPG